MNKLTQLFAVACTTASISLSGGWHLQGKPLADRVNELERRLLDLELRLEPKADVKWNSKLASALSSAIRDLMTGDLSPATLYEKHRGSIPEDKMRAIKDISYANQLINDAAVSYATRKSMRASELCNRALNIYNECADLASLPAFDTTQRK